MVFLAHYHIPYARDKYWSVEWAGTWRVSAADLYGKSAGGVADGEELWWFRSAATATTSDEQQCFRFWIIPNAGYMCIIIISIFNGRMWRKLNSNLTVIDSQSQSTEIMATNPKTWHSLGKGHRRRFEPLVTRQCWLSASFLCRGSVMNTRNSWKKWNVHTNTSWSSPNKRNDVEMCKLDDDDDRALQISTGKVRLTKTGFVALGIRKALALSSAVAFPLAILFDVSRQTVCRAETICLGHACDAVSRVPQNHQWCVESNFSFLG